MYGNNQNKNRALDRRTVVQTHWQQIAVDRRVCSSFLLVPVYDGVTEPLASGAPWFHDELHVSDRGQPGISQFD